MQRSPFCHRALLTLEEKNLKYTMTFVDLGNKPAWLFEKNAKGTVPIMEQDGKIIPDSDVIVNLLEEQVPSPSLKNPNAEADAIMKGNTCFKQARDFVKMHGGDEEKAKEAELLKELRQIEDYLKAHGPLFGGNKVCQADFAVAPKLYHITTALPVLKNWNLPADFTAIPKYLDMVGLDSLRLFFPIPTAILKGCCPFRPRR